MITSVIFSKNRACQLDLLLRSLTQNLPDFNDIVVLYKATTERFEEGYTKLISRFPEITYISEINFEQTTFYVLENLCKKYVCFFVDDNIIYRRSGITPRHIVSLFDQIEHMGCFSMRLGLNTVVQAPYANPPRTLNINWPMKQVKIEDQLMLAWQWNALPPHDNFGYGFSVDGHVYNKQVVLNGLTYEFDTPNAFEGRFEPKHIPPVMMCSQQSILVNNPINLVGSSNNDAGKWWGHTLEELNNAYLGDKIINLEPLCKNKVVGCHQEMEIELV
jgi:hypothetical protein